jgi:F-type H+-transporting ATPase subunit b
MHIDLFVLGAQIFNFLVLVFLLKYFLFDRLTAAMDAREAGIAVRFQEAERLKSEAQESVREYEERNRALGEREEALMLDAQKAAEQEKAQLMDKVRVEVEQVRQRWYESMGREKKAFLEGLRRRAGKYVYDTIRNVLADMADQELEERIVQVFVARVRAMDEPGQERLRESLNAGTPMVAVQSAFPLSPDRQREIEEAVGRYTGDGVPVRFRVSPDVGAGIELMARGYKLSWSVDDYLSGLEEQFVRSLKEEIKLEARPA